MIYKELPTVFPFYEKVNNQNRFRENIENINQFKLLCSNNALLPFQIKSEKGKGKPKKWAIKKIDGPEFDITNNLNLISVYEFEDSMRIVYFGDVLNYAYNGNISKELNIPCGDYYVYFEFENGSKYVSEVFTVKKDLSKCIKISYWDNFDIEPIIYRDNFKQVIYFDTFVSSFEPEIESEEEKDGFNNSIPIFQKLTLRYKFVESVPDFVKVSLMSMQMHENIYIEMENRKGYTSRIEINNQNSEDTGLNDVEVIFEDDILIKTSCQENKPATNKYTW